MPDESFEKTLEQRLTPLVEKKLKPIKKRLGDLTRRVESLELMAFQDQLDDLDKRITKNSKELTKAIEQDNKALLESARWIADLNVNLHLLWALYEFSVRVYNDPSCAHNARLCEQYARERTIKALADINHSNRPLKIYDAWYKKCKDYFDERGFNLFN